MTAGTPTPEPVDVLDGNAHSAEEIAQAMEDEETEAGLTPVTEETSHAARSYTVRASVMRYGAVGAVKAILEAVKDPDAVLAALGRGGDVPNRPTPPGHTLHAEASDQHVALRLECSYEPNDPNRPCLTYQERPAGSEDGYGPEIPGCGAKHWLNEEVDAADVIIAGKDQTFDLPAAVDVSWDGFDECWNITPAAAGGAVAVPPAASMPSGLAEWIHGLSERTDDPLLMGEASGWSETLSGAAAVPAAASLRATLRRLIHHCTTWHGSCCPCDDKECPRDFADDVLRGAVAVPEDRPGPEEVVATATLAALTEHQWHPGSAACRCGWRWTPPRAQDVLGWERHQAGAVVAALRAVEGA